MIKLIASDLDETLLDESSRLSEENKRVIGEALAQGLTFTLATGRMYQSAAPFAREIGLGSEQPIICYNGALIKRLSGETLYEKSLSPELASMIAGYGQKQGWTVNAYFDDELYVAAMNQEVEDYIALAQVGVAVVDDLVDFVQEGKKHLAKILIIGQPDEMPGRIEELKSLVGSEVQIVRSRNKFIEITNMEAHKGASLLWLAKSMGLTASEVMAIGDSNNDLTMLKMAGIGVAVANASQVVKDAASHQTGANFEHGVAEAITKYALKKES